MSELSHSRDSCDCAGTFISCDCTLGYADQFCKFFLCQMILFSLKDVYKRQPLRPGLSDGGCATVVRAGSAGPGCLGSVSYTHLDVYKRQVCFIGGKAKRTEVCQPVGKQE